jgi:hypothetical protein
MVTRKELIVRGNQPEQQGRSEIARRSPQGLSEISLEFDPEQLQRAFPPVSEVNQPRATFVQNIYIGGDYHYRDEAAGAWAALTDKKDRKHRRELEREAREDRRERAADRSARIELGMFAGYMLTLIIIVGVIGLCTFALTAMGMFHH